MTVKVVTRCKATANEHGSEVRYYEAGEVIDVSEPWKAKLAELLINAGLAEEAKVTAPTETKVAEATETKTRRKSKK